LAAGLLDLGNEMGCAKQGEVRQGELPSPATCCSCSLKAQLSQAAGEQVKNTALKV